MGQMECPVDDMECDEDYIGESARTIWERLKKHFRALSSIYDHANITGHQTIVGRESHNLARTIKEAIYIRINGSSLNRNIERTSCPTYGMKPCSKPQTLNSNRPSDISIWAYLCYLPPPQDGWGHRSPHNVLSYIVHS